MIPFWCRYNHLHPSSKMGMNMNKTYIWIIDYHCTCSKGCSWVGAQFTEQRTCVSSPRAVPKSAPAVPYLPNWLETDPRMASVRSSPFFFSFSSPFSRCFIPVVNWKEHQRHRHPRITADARLLFLSLLLCLFVLFGLLVLFVLLFPGRNRPQTPAFSLYSQWTVTKWLACLKLLMLEEELWKWIRMDQNISKLSL